MTANKPPVKPTHGKSQSQPSRPSTKGKGSTAASKAKPVTVASRCRYCVHSLEKHSIDLCRLCNNEYQICRIYKCHHDRCMSCFPDGSFASSDAHRLN